MRDLLSKLDNIVEETANIEEIQNFEENLTSDQEDLSEELFQIGDDFGISFTENFEISTEISDIAEDGIVIDLDEEAIDFLESQGVTFVEDDLIEEKIKGKDGKACWKGYRYNGTKDGKDSCVKVKEDEDIDEASASDAEKRILTRIRQIKYDQKLSGTDSNHAELVKLQKELKDIRSQKSVSEAEYQGRNVPLGKPMKGDVKKSKVYVRKPNGNIVKVNFGDKKMRIKKSNPKRRKSFRARHNCSNPGPRWKARYWSCRAW